MFIPVYILLICFITGFPKANNTELDYTLSNINKNSTTCKINTTYLKQSLIEKDNISCNKITKKEVSGDEFKLNSIPKINITLFSIVLLLLLTEVKAINQFLILKNKRLKKIFSKF